MQRKISFSLGEYYHLYNRGVDKRTIFFDNTDRDRFQKLLYICNGVEPVVFRDVEDYELDKIKRGNPLVSIGAYCLMDNHFHILIKEIEEGGISKFMKKLATGYSMYFNRKNQRTGALFENNFKAKHADDDGYLKYLFSYIHLNPVKLIEPEWKDEGLKDIEKVKKHLLDYRYSSYFDFLGIDRMEKNILKVGDFPEYFIENDSFDKYMDDWLRYKEWGESSS